MTDEQSGELPAVNASGGLAEPTELEPQPGTLALADAKDTHTRADWERAAAGVLRRARRLGEDDDDASVWSKLAKHTLDGVQVTALGTPRPIEESSLSARPARHGAWDIRAHLELSDPVADHESLITDLEGGATSLWLEASADTDWETLLDGAFLDLAPVVLDGDADMARSFLGYAEGLELHPATNLGVAAAQATADLARAASAAGVLAFVVDGTDVHDRGASDVQELAHSMAVAVAYLRSLTTAGVDLDDAVRLVEFRYAVSDEQFESIAKLRAARGLWTRVLEICTARPAEQRQHAVTSRPMLSKYDPWVNMLRTTVAAFAAGVGGADAVTVLPFDTPLGVPDDFARRIARNTSALLIEEAHVAVVTDPAGGAHAVEQLTEDLADAAWELFVRLDGGEDLEPLIETTVAARDRQVATRRRPITGLTEFPNLAEDLPERRPAPSASAVRRYGAAFEALREHPRREPVFLATMGTVAAHTARATFAANLLAAGGIRVEVAGATGGGPALVSAYAGQSVVCVAGTDDAYDQWGADAATALRAAGAAWVVVAGKPRDWADDSCAMGVDAIEFLTTTREKLS